MIPKYIPTFDALITSADATREGFVEQAQIKAKKAAPYIKQAKKLHLELEKAATAEDIVQLSSIEKELIAAAGISSKATKHIESQIISDVMREVFVPLGDDFREEVLCRFLLTRGDSLGGTMRNVIGAMAYAKVVEILKRVKPDAEETKTKTGKVSAISWSNLKGDRILFFDKKNPVVDKSIDFTLVDVTEDKLTASGIVLDKKLGRKFVSSLLNVTAHCLALGELKGGVDPAGADEHWKTASKALQRIRESFTSHPAIFFIAGAIEAAMAAEIFEELETGELTHAANLTVEEQVVDLMEWLVSL